ncbi:MAG TPA: coenzyme F420-0:L-glutamate ligase [Candidatus Paceibacterota bacterium]
MRVNPVKTRIFKEGEKLAAFVGEHIPRLEEGSILVVASKIVALAEGRTVVVENAKQKEELIRKESEWMKHVFGKWWLTVRDGTVVVNAGIDESNVRTKLTRSRQFGTWPREIILLPKNAFTSAARLRKQLMKHFDISKCGVIITDSRITPLRAGVVGVALGYAGFRGVKDYRGTPDLFGRPMEVTQTDVADSLATAATLVMGEGSESQPLAVIEDAPVVWTDSVDRDELKIPRDQDMFRSLFEDHE